MRRTLLVVFLIFTLSLPAALLAYQATPQFVCGTSSGYGAEINPSHYVLDLRCRPALAETIEIPPGGAITVTVELENYFTATGLATATFDLHFAMDRAWLTVREQEAVSGTTLRDTLSALHDVGVITSEPSYSFVIENEGFRSAVFDLSVRPQE
jgi:hypothetical protein